MQPSTTIKKSVRSIGSIITREYFEHLIDGFAQMHPTEEKSVYIAREFIAAALSESPEVCGIRFMYGQEEDADPESRIVLLMACYEKESGSPVPNLLLTSKGHLTQEGERVSANQCWELFDRHVSRMSVLMPEAARRDIPRGCFFGKESLKELIEREGCTGIRFHFGYNPATAYLPDRYESALEAMSSRVRSLGVFMEDGTRCPPICPPGSPEGAVFAVASESRSI